MRVGLGELQKPSQPMLVFSSIGLLLLLAGRFYPFDRFPLIICPLRTFAHVPCPSCGMTRAFVRFTHGDWGSAIHVSPFGFLLAGTAAFFAIYSLLRMTVMRRGLDLRLNALESKTVRFGIPILFLVNWVYLLVTGAAN